MADAGPGKMSPAEERAAWNEAHQRLLHYLQTFALGDQVEVSRLALRFIDQAREQHRADSSQHPTAVTLRHAQSEVNNWLALNLDQQDQVPSRIAATGCVALLLSGLSQREPDAFLASNVPEKLKSSMQHALMVTGPDLTVSSMTPRHLDYGPLLDIARQTWHRWDAKSFSTALLFWFCVYWVCYWFLSEYL